MTIKQPSTFTVSGLPPGIFGEAYVVISVWKPSATKWMAEYNILTTRPQENLDSCVVEFDVANYPPELESIDEAYMEAEAARQAQIDLELELGKRAIIVGRPEVAYLPLTLKRTKISPVTLWVRNLLPMKFADMANQTKSSDLKKYLQMVMGLEKLKAA
jgi:hypothetical protein